MKISPAQIEFASVHLGKIDSGARSIFLETVNTENQIEIKIFGNDKMLGVFHSGIAYERFWISISFETDTKQFNDELARLIRDSMKKSGFTSAMIWLRNDNRKIIEFLKKEFHIPPEGNHYYASIEFIMRRTCFAPKVEECVLEIRSFEEKHIDKYLDMMDKSFTFADPPPKFKENKEQNAKRFAELSKANSFEAFWKDNKLVGLYWRKNAEIDFLAVDVNHQRKGYGHIILTRAIEMIFANTTDDYAYLYAVDWNSQGQSFYKKYGMEQNGHSYLLRLNNYDCRNDFI